MLAWPFRIGRQQCPDDRADYRSCLPDGFWATITRSVSASTTTRRTQKNRDGRVAGRFSLTVRIGPEVSRRTDGCEGGRRRSDIWPIPGGFSPPPHPPSSLAGRRQISRTIRWHYIRVRRPRVFLPREYYRTTVRRAGRSRIKRLRYISARTGRNIRDRLPTERVENATGFTQYASICVRVLYYARCPST